MHILLRGGEFVNKGAETMVLTTVSELQKRIPKASFFMERAFLPEPAEDFARMQGIKPIQYDHPGKSSKALSMAIACAIQPWNAAKALRMPNKWLETDYVASSIDAIIDISGYAYGARWGRYRAIENLCFQARRARKGRPFVFFPQAWGPFTEETGEIRRAIKAMCLAADAVYARDTTSHEYLVELLGRTPQNLHLAPDIAFAYHPEHEPTPFDDWLNQMGEKGLCGILGIAPNRQLYVRSQGQGTWNQYFRQLKEICRYCLKKGFALAILPHEYEFTQDGTLDDRLLATALVDSLGSDMVFTTEDRLNAAQLKGIISRLDGLIGSGFHTLVGALSSRVPCCALGWSHKYHELLAPFGLNEYVCNLLDTEGDRTALHVVERFLHDYGSLREAIDPVAVDIEKTVDSFFDEIALMLKQKLGSG